jgi:hypothetical protein
MVPRCLLTLHITIIHFHHLSAQTLMLINQLFDFWTSILFKSIRHIKQRALSNSLELLWFFLPALHSIARCYINLPSFVFLLVLPFLRIIVSHILELSCFYKAPIKSVSSLHTAVDFTKHSEALQVPRQIYKVGVAELISALTLEFHGVKSFKIHSKSINRSYLQRRFWFQIAGSILKFKVWRV